LNITLLSALQGATTNSFEFFVAGAPAVQGSKTAFGRVVRGQDGKPRAVVNMVEQDKGLGEWRYSVSQMGRLMRPKGWSKQGIFMLSAIFYLPRPNAHFNVSGHLRASAPVFHSKRKDCDKMLRAIGDALTDICYEDDCLLVSVSGFKAYCNPQGDGEGARIFVAHLDEGMAGAAAQPLLF